MTVHVAEIEISIIAVIRIVRNYVSCQQSILSAMIIIIDLQVLPQLSVIMSVNQHAVATQWIIEIIATACPRVIDGLAQGHDFDIDAFLLL